MTDTNLSYDNKLHSFLRLSLSIYSVIFVKFDYFTHQQIFILHLDIILKDVIQREVGLVRSLG